MAMWNNSTMTLNDGGEPERLSAVVASDNLFSLFGVAPLHGRLFAPGEPDANVVLSYGVWTRRFGAEHNLLGQMLRINDRLLRVVGIMPPGFQFTIRSGPLPDAWIPMVIRRSDSRSGRAIPTHSMRRVTASSSPMTADTLSPGAAGP